MSVKSIFRRFYRFANPLKYIKVLLKERLGWLGIPILLPYIAYVYNDKMVITGAVIEDKGLSTPEEKQSLWSNLLAMIKRYTGDEMAGARVRIRFRGQDKVVQTNRKGVFHTILRVDETYDPAKEWQTISYTLLDEIVEGQGRVEAEGYAYFVNPKASFLVISDIDDTILVSHSTSFYKKMRLMLFKNALTRSPLEGVSLFYKALHHPDQNGPRPIFYVSGSEYNLYDLITDFFEYRGIPRGPMMLSEYKTRLFSLLRSGNKLQEKQWQVRELLERFFRHDFILIGDSGQKDPEIYLDILRMFPSRIKAIYIRYVGKKRRNRRLERIAEEVAELGSELVTVHDTEEALEHARRRGFIEHRAT